MVREHYGELASKSFTSHSIHNWSFQRWVFGSNLTNILEWKKNKIVPRTDQHRNLNNTYIGLHSFIRLFYSLASSQPMKRRRYNITGKNKRKPHMKIWKKSISINTSTPYLKHLCIGSDSSSLGIFFHGPKNVTAISEAKSGLYLACRNSSNPVCC